MVDIKVLIYTQALFHKSIQANDLNKNQEHAIIKRKSKRNKYL